METDEFVVKEMNENLIEKCKENTYNLYLLIAEIIVCLICFIFGIITKHWEEYLFSSLLMVRLFLLFIERSKINIGINESLINDINGFIKTKIGYILTAIMYVFILLFLIIDIMNLTMRYNWDDFPNSCIKDGCTSVTDQLQTRSGIMLYSNNKISFNYDEEAVMEIVENWFNTYTTINMRKNSNIIYADFKISFFGFWDSMMVKIVNKNNITTVYSFSEQIIGYYDFSVNDKRILDLYDYLHKNLK